VISSLILATGLPILLQGSLMLFMTARIPGGGGFFSIFTFINFLIGLGIVLLGVGLLMRNELARNIAVWFCWIRVVLGILGLIFGGPVVAIGGSALGVIYTVSVWIGIASAGFMIYLIGETDTMGWN
jgi:hypothetical protein